jgi:hypothetical protein
MGNRADTLREEAARCLALAQTAADPVRRAELVHMAARFSELAESPGIDFEGIQQIFNDAQLGTAKPGHIPQQQQQQPQANPEPEVSAPLPPHCPACGAPMRLTGSQPTAHDVNLDQLKYACDCGETVEKTVAHRG